jgi:hypothetical protein
MYHKVFHLTAAAIIIVAFAGMSCDKSNPMSPYQPEINNITDNFQFQITAAKNLDHSENYIWRNTGAGASINQSCSNSDGTATLTISDSTGTELYSRNLSDNGTFQSSAGVPGPWIIRVSFTNLDGTINFRAQKL